MKIIAIVVYEPTYELKNRLENISNNFEIIIFKNSKIDFIVNHNNLTLLGNEENQGLGKALNEINNYVLKKGGAKFLYFDQDTNFNNESINLIFDNQEYKNSQIVNYRKSKTFKVNKKKWQFIINSGSLFDSNSIYNIGGFNEEFFVDIIDFEISYRIIKNGGEIVTIHSDIEIDHKNQQSENIITIFGKKYSLIKKYNIKRVKSIYKNTGILLRSIIKDRSWLAFLFIVNFILIFTISRIIVRFKN